MKILTYFNIQSFLKFGFFLDSEENAFNLDTTLVSPGKYKDYSTDDLVDIGYEIIYDSFVKLLGNNSSTNSSHVVPISAGLDSRMVLGFLIKIIGADNVNTYTYGQRGTIDFNVANQLANKLEVNHTNFVLSSKDYTFSSLTDAASRLNYRVPVFYHPKYKDIEKYFSEYTVWSGFLGCLWKGKSLPLEISNSKNEATKNFINFNNIKQNLCKETDDFFSYFLENSLEKNSPISMTISFLSIIGR